jgi:hypothetical protein
MLYITWTPSQRSSPAPRARPCNRFPRAPTQVRVGSPTLIPCHMVQATDLTQPRGPDVAPTEPTDLAQLRSHVTQSFFTVHSAILIKHQLFFEFSISHFVTSLLQCSTIFASALSHFRELSYFLVAIVNSTILI